jgi:hypothetical protein
MCAEGVAHHARGWYGGERMRKTNLSAWFKLGKPTVEEFATLLRVRCYDVELGFYLCAITDLMPHGKLLEGISDMMATSQKSVALPILSDVTVAQFEQHCWGEACWFPVDSISGRTASKNIGRRLVPKGKVHDAKDAVSAVGKLNEALAQPDSQSLDSETEEMLQAKRPRCPGPCSDSDGVSRPQKHSQSACRGEGPEGEQYDVEGADAVLGEENGGLAH